MDLALYRVDSHIHRLEISGVDEGPVNLYFYGKHLVAMDDSGTNFIHDGYTTVIPEPQQNVIEKLEQSSVKTVNRLSRGGLVKKAISVLLTRPISQVPEPAPEPVAKEDSKPIIVAEAKKKRRAKIA